MMVYGEILSTLVIANQQPSTPTNPNDIFISRDHKKICRCGGMEDIQDLGSCA